MLKELESIFDECWLRFSADHPEYPKPYVRLISDIDAWGCCDCRDETKPVTIYVNRDILTKFKDRETTKDIIYHELCHLIYHDDEEKTAFGHPREFWDELDKYDSKFIKQRAEILEHNKKELEEIVEDLEW